MHKVWKKLFYNFQDSDTANRLLLFLVKVLVIHIKLLINQMIQQSTNNSDPIK